MHPVYQLQKIMYLLNLLNKHNKNEMIHARTLCQTYCMDYYIIMLVYLIKLLALHCTARKAVELMTFIGRLHRTKSTSFYVITKHFVIYRSLKMKDGKSEHKKKEES